MRALPAVLVTLGVVALACSSSSPEEAPLVVTDMALGSLKLSDGALVLDQERARLPRVAGTSGDLAHTFGICFQATGGARPGALAIHVFPPAKITETELSRTGEGVRVPVELERGVDHLCQEMFFDATDPVGPWRFELRDGVRTLRAWDIEVYEP